MTQVFSQASNHNPMTPYHAASPRWRAISDTPRAYISPMFDAVLAQLPEGVARRVDVSLTTDPYYLATVATFTTEDGRAFKVRLKAMELADGKLAAARVPTEFIAHLCVAL